MILWHDGFFKDDNHSNLPVIDRGFTLGDGIFDTMMAKEGQFLYADHHFNRLFDHAASFDIVIPYTKETLQECAHQLLEKNNGHTGFISLRTTVTRGSGKRGLVPPETPCPVVLMTLSFFDPQPLQNPASAIIAESVRRNEGSPLSRIKSLNYGDNILAQIEAQKKGADTALMMNNAGHLCCATNSNIFIIEGSQFITPPLYDGVLNGIIRQNIITQYSAREETIQTERLLKADAVFLTNSLTGIRPIYKINDTNFAYITISNLSLHAQ